MATFIVCSSVLEAFRSPKGTGTLRSRSRCMVKVSFFQILVYDLDLPIQAALIYRREKTACSPSESVHSSMRGIKYTSCFVTACIFGTRRKRVANCPSSVRQLFVRSVRTERDRFLLPKTVFWSRFPQPRVSLDLPRTTQNESAPRPPGMTRFEVLQCILWIYVFIVY